MPAPHGPSMTIYRKLILTLNSANFNDMGSCQTVPAGRAPKRVKTAAYNRRSSREARDRERRAGARRSQIGILKLARPIAIRVPKSIPTFLALSSYFRNCSGSLSGQ